MNIFEKNIESFKIDSIWNFKKHNKFKLRFVLGMSDFSSLIL